MSFTKGALAPNRKLPANDILLEDFRDGLTNVEIARKHKCSPGSVASHFLRLGLRGKSVSAEVTPLGQQHRRRDDVVVVQRVDGSVISLPRVRGYYEGVDG